MYSKKQCQPCTPKAHGSVFLRGPKKFTCHFIAKILSIIFSFKNTFIQILIFSIFKYTYRPYFQNPDIFVLRKGCSVAIQTSIFRMILLQII